MAVELLPWVLFNAFILLMLALDLLVFHRTPRAISIREAVGWSIFWIILALLFNLYLYYVRGPEPALNFLTGYLIEKSLSIDNLFVFFLIFNYFHTPRQSLHRVLFWGVFGAIIFRALFIWLGITLLSKFHAIIYLMGIFLVYTGIKLGFEKDKEIHPDKNPVLRLFHLILPCTDKYDGEKFFVKKNSRYVATPLFVVLLAIETTDIIFAVDSIPAILAITFDPFIVYTSNIFAILGLRSLYFVLEGMMGLFHHLHYGLSFILVFIGIKMCLMDFYKMPTAIALGVVFLVIALSIILSILYPKQKYKV